MLTENQRIFIRGFEAFQHDRKQLHTVIVTFVRNPIPAVEVQHYDKDDLEYQTVKLLLLAGDMYITNTYSSPSTPLSLKSTNTHNTRDVSDCWGDVSARS
ncbi:hypothetical protein ElyMa_003738800 [Elysia marginata]|uniref:Uncharacterized protein n=1 Tax=Elysia marginata TaxID=1093978 RepID=A0AAV4F6P6_9GAST|nr:hypothetical protein ElyMa_003738800 [Elysia marginata]